MCRRDRSNMQLSTHRQLVSTIRSPSLYVSSPFAGSDALSTKRDILISHSGSVSKCQLCRFINHNKHHPTSHLTVASLVASPVDACRPARSHRQVCSICTSASSIIDHTVQRIIRVAILRCRSTLDFPNLVPVDACIATIISHWISLDTSHEPSAASAALHDRYAHIESAICTFASVDAQLASTL